MLIEQIVAAKVWKQFQNRVPWWIQNFPNLRCFCGTFSGTNNIACQKNILWKEYKTEFSNVEGILLLYTARCHHHESYVEENKENNQGELVKSRGNQRNTLNIENVVLIKTSESSAHFARFTLYFIRATFCFTSLCNF